MLHGIKVFPHLRQFFYPADNLGRVWENLRKSMSLLGMANGHADADIHINIRIICISRAISDICRMMRISVSMRIGKYIRMAIPSWNSSSALDLVSGDWVGC